MVFVEPGGELDAGGVRFCGEQDAGRPGPRCRLLV